MASRIAYATICFPTIETMPSEARRLHPASWLFITASSVKSLIIPAIVVMFVYSGALLIGYRLLSVLFIVPALVAALLKQGVYNYRFADDELIVRDGILVRKERHIPYERVHNVALVQNPFHRMLKVASVRIETASGGAPEAVMRVLSLDAVQELRDHTLNRRRAAAAAPGAGEALIDAEVAVDEGGAATAAAADSPDGAAAADASLGSAAAAESTLLSLPTRELVRLGLISNRGLVIVAAAFGAISQVDWWEFDWIARYNPVRDDAPDWLMWVAAPGSIKTRVLLGIALAIAFVVVSLVLLRVFSVCFHVIKYHGFTLSRDGDDIRTEYGMFTRVSSIIPAHRIQLLTHRASLLHRWLGRSAIEIEMAGASESGSDLQQQLAASGVRTERQWLAPLIEPGRAGALVHDVLPEVDLEEVEWKPLAAGARRRIIRRSALILSLPTIPLALALHFALSGSLSGLHALWLLAVGVPLAAVYAGKYVEHAGFALTDRAVFFRSGWLSRKVSVVRFNKVQTVALNESPFDRRNRMASIAVDTAGAAQTGHRIDIPYLEREVAEAIARRLYAEASHTEYSW